MQSYALWKPVTFQVKSTFGTGAVSGNRAPFSGRPSKQVIGISGLNTVKARGALDAPWLPSLHVTFQLYAPSGRSVTLVSQVRPLLQDMPDCLTLIGPLISRTHCGVAPKPAGIQENLMNWVFIRLLLVGWSNDTETAENEMPINAKMKNAAQKNLVGLVGTTLRILVCDCISIPTFPSFIARKNTFP